MTFVRNNWYPAAWASEVTREPMARTLLNDPVVLYRTAEGAPVALEDRCCHKYLPLSMGTIQGNNVQCGYHGMVFGPDGKCVRIPGQARIPENAWVRSYPVAEHYGMVWFWPGDPALASTEKLFDKLFQPLQFGGVAGRLFVDQEGAVGDHAAHEQRFLEAQ